MPTFTWSNGNQGIFGYNRFRDFDDAVVTDTSIVARYNGGSGSYDPTRLPWEIRFDFENAETHTFETGPRTGETIYSAGTVTRVSFFNQDGDLLIRVSDLAVDLPALMIMRDFDVGDIWEFLGGGGSTYIGSNDGSGPVQDWDGDDITTGRGDDTVRSGGGDDFIKDRGGADIYVGGDGSDTLSYEEWFWSPGGATSGIVANLGRGRITGPDGEVDRVRSIENLRGTFLDDQMRGNGADNRFDGHQGNDFFDGRGGFDRVSYRDDSRWGGEDGIRANLGNNRVRDGFGNTDRLRNIEGVEGTNNDDVFIDNAGDNWFRGRDGDDIFRLGEGNDYARGEGGADFFVFRGTSFGADFIDGFEDGTDRIQIEEAARFRQLTITQDGDDAVITYRGSEVRLGNFDSNDLNASDFVF